MNRKYEIQDYYTYMLMSHYYNAGQNHSTKKVNRSFGDVAKFKHLGTTLTDQNCMHKGD
jgi:hypothetical protein